jgi:toxin ParE1/3/4
MPRIVRTYPARDDLRQIWLHIAKHNMTAADRLIDRFERTLYTLARHPHIGESVEQFQAGLRRFTVGNYVLYYEKNRDGIRLVRVLHGARKAEDLFGSD